MNTAFKKINNYFRTAAAVLTAAVMSLSAADFNAVFADNAEKAELAAAGDMAEVILTLPQAAAEGISSVQISLEVKANTDNAEITFVPNEKLNAKIQESRYHKDTGMLNIYTVGTSPLFDKTDPTVSLGYVKLSTNEENGAAANVAFVRDSLKFVRSGVLAVYDNGLSYSEAVKIKVGNGGEGEPPVITQPVVTDEEPPATSETQAPVETAEPPVTVNPPSSEDEEQPQPIDLTELKELLATAEGFNAADYTEDSFKILQDAIKEAKGILNSPNPSQEEIEEACMLLENAIGMLTEKTDRPPADVTTGHNAEEPSQSGEGGSNNGENTSQNGEGGSDNEGNASQNGGGTSEDEKSPSTGDKSDNGGFNPLVIVLVAVVVIVVGLAVAIVITVNKGKSGGQHSK